MRKFYSLMYLIGITSFILMCLSSIIVIFELFGIYMLYVDIKIPLITQFDTVVFVLLVIFGFPIFISVLILNKKGVIKID